MTSTPWPDSIAGSQWPRSSRNHWCQVCLENKRGSMKFLLSSWVKPPAVESSCSGDVLRTLLLIMTQGRVPWVHSHHPSDASQICSSWLSWGAEEEDDDDVVCCWSDCWTRNDAWIKLLNDHLQIADHQKHKKKKPIMVKGSSVRIRVLIIVIIISRELQTRVGSSCPLPPPLFSSVSPLPGSWWPLRICNCNMQLLLKDHEWWPWMRWWSAFGDGTDPFDPPIHLESLFFPEPGDDDVFIHCNRMIIISSWVLYLCCYLKSCSRRTERTLEINNKRAKMIIVVLKH